MNIYKYVYIHMEILVKAEVLRPGLGCKGNFLPRLEHNMRDCLHSSTPRILLVRRNERNLEFMDKNLCLRGEQPLAEPV